MMKLWEKEHDVFNHIKILNDFQEHNYELIQACIKLFNIVNYNLYYQSYILYIKIKHGLKLIYKLEGG